MAKDRHSEADVESRRILDRVSHEAESGGPIVVDVRTPRERASGYVAGSLHVPLSQLAERSGELPAGRPILVYCAGGYRSSVAASLLQRNGFSDVSEIAGGMAAWEAARLPIEQPHCRAKSHLREARCK